ncbi:hypothetical protein [Leisingera caerulea]|uniref:hypothetical protein n=1 Tax=Leisingera caerulea TaxID=506591 RepID=UPI000485963E|nr:hypothetical protein [Leisingera caerulea]
MAKDLWDKAEVIGKILGAVLIPAVLGYSVHSYNSTASTRATAAQMAGIAVGVLMNEPSKDQAAGDALRMWAVDVLENPGEITPLDPSAAKQLLLEGLPTFPWTYSGLGEGKFDIKPGIEPERNPE